jgi:hypothetical protein
MKIASSSASLMSPPLPDRKSEKYRDLVLSGAVMHEPGECVTSPAAVPTSNCRRDQTVPMRRPFIDIAAIQTQRRDKMPWNFFRT